VGGSVMNTMGKILVFIILLLSLATAGFHVIDAAVRTNWQAAYEKMEENAKAARANADAARSSYEALAKKYEALEDRQKKSAEFFDVKQKELQAKYDAKEAEYLKQVELSEKASAGELAANEERKRLGKENKDVKDRLELALKESLDKEILILKYRQ